MAKSKKLERGKSSRKRKAIRIPTAKLSAKDVKEVFNSMYMTAVVNLLTKYLGKIEFVTTTHTEKPKTRTPNPAYRPPRPQRGVHQTPTQKGPDPRLSQFPKAEG